MKSLKIWIALFIGALAMSACGSAKKAADADTRQWRYEIEPVATGVQGTYQIKVWSYSKDPNVAAEQAKKNAVHGVIFKGIAGTQRLQSQKALVTDSNMEEKRKDFFESFFADGGAYMKFVNLTNNHLTIAAGDRIKIGKEYKVGIIVSVNKDALRKELENAGIIAKLGDIF
ncbi:MAG: hypothetical protein LBT61_02020 [Prevotellaceae bacterium]|jgi:hypothetical protein|nr:hypothetical protein [Prevotellaceae bacterium]